MNEETNTSMLQILPGCCICRSFTMNLEPDGRVIVEGERKPTLSEYEQWNNVIRISGGTDHVVGLRSDGTVVAFGDNTYHQCETSAWKSIKHLQACGCMSLGVDENDELYCVGVAGYADETGYNYFTEEDTISNAGSEKCYANIDKHFDNDFEWRMSEGGITIKGYKGSSDTVIIPEKISGFDVIEIGHSAFKNSCIIENVILPNTVKRIGSFAFKGCKRLKSIIIPHSVADFSSGVFWDCSMLTVYCPSDSPAAVHCYTNKVRYCNSFVNRYVYIENGISVVNEHDYITSISDIPYDVIERLSVYAYNKLFKMYENSGITVRSLEFSAYQMCYGPKLMNTNEDGFTNLLFLYYDGIVLINSSSEITEQAVYNFCVIPDLYFEKIGTIHYDINALSAAKKTFKCCNKTVPGFMSKKSLDKGVDKYIQDAIPRKDQNDYYEGQDLESTGKKYYDRYKPRHKELIEEKNKLSVLLSSHGMSNKFLVELIADAQCNLDKISLINELNKTTQFKYEKPDIETYKRIYDYFSSFPEVKKKPEMVSLSRTNETFHLQKICDIEAEFFGYPEQLYHKQIKKQGESIFPLSGTCGYCSSANVLTTAGDPLMNEERIISEAMNGSEETIIALELFSPYAEERGGSYSSTMKEILERMGCPALYCCKNFEMKTTMEQYYGILSSGRVMIISVNAGRFWREKGYGGHAITLLSVSKDCKYFVYNDTGYGKMGVATAEHIFKSLLSSPAVYSRDILY